MVGKIGGTLFEAPSVDTLHRLGDPEVQYLTPGEREAGEYGLAGELVREGEAHLRRLG